MHPADQFNARIADALELLAATHALPLIRAQINDKEANMGTVAASKNSEVQKLYDRRDQLLSTINGDKPDEPSDEKADIPVDVPESTDTEVVKEGELTTFGPSPLVDVDELFTEGPGHS